MEKVEIVLSRMSNFEVEVGGEKIPVSSSRGWAQYQVNDTARELIGRADAALYAHKTGAEIETETTLASNAVEVAAT
jgi:GGDEF domain-containing protein